MLDVGCWMLDVGCWMLDVGCWMLCVGCCPAGLTATPSPTPGARERPARPFTYCPLSRAPPPRRPSLPWREMHTTGPEPSRGFRMNPPPGTSAPHYAYIAEISKPLTPL